MTKSYLDTSSLDSSFSSISTKFTVDDLNKKLDQIESKNVLDPQTMINDIVFIFKGMKSNEFPNRPVEPLFKFALKVYEKFGDSNNNIHRLMRYINRLCKPSEILNLYVSNYKISSAKNKDFLNECYLIIPNHKKESFPDGTSWPISLSKPENNEENNEVRVAFNYLGDWSVAYEGVVEIWKCIQDDNLCDDIYNCFVDLDDYSRRCFLIHGLETLAKEENKLYDVIDKIKLLKKSLDKSSKSEVAYLQADQLNEKMNKINSSPNNDKSRKVRKGRNSYSPSSIKAILDM